MGFQVRGGEARAGAASRAPALVTIVTIITLASSAARAQSGADIATRRSLIEQAQAAAGAGDHARAVDLGERAGRIEMSASLRAFLAIEQRQVGHVAEALGHAEACAREARTDTRLTNREAIQAQCERLVSELRSAVGQVTVRVEGTAPQGLEVRVNGAVINEALYGAPYVVTPGTVHVEARAPGYNPFQTDVAATAGANVDVPLALVAAPQPATAAGAGVGREGNARPGPAIAGPVILMSVGAVGVIVGVVFEVLRSNATSRLESSYCRHDDPSSCANIQPAMDLAADADRAQLGRGISLIVGGAALAAGAVWLGVAVGTSGRNARPASPQSDHAARGPGARRAAITRPGALVWPTLAPPRYGDGLVLGVGGTL